MITAHVTHLRIEERTLTLTGEKAECYVFDWYVKVVNDWAGANERVRDALKREVPAADRDWDPDGKRWSVKVEYRGVLGKIFGNFEETLKALAESPVLF